MSHITDIMKANATYHGFQMGYDKKLIDDILKKAHDLVSQKQFFGIMK